MLQASPGAGAGGEGDAPMTQLALTGLQGLIPPHHLLAVFLSEHEEDLACVGGFLKDTAVARDASQEPVPRRFWHRIPWLRAGMPTNSSIRTLRSMVRTSAGGAQLEVEWPAWLDDVKPSREELFSSNLDKCSVKVPAIAPALTTLPDAHPRHIEGRVAHQVKEGMRIRQHQKDHGEHQPRAPAIKNGRGFLGS